MKTALAFLLGVALAGVAFLLFLNANDDTERLVSDQKPVLGETITVTVYSSSNDNGREAIEATFSRAAELESIVSSADPKSALTRLNEESHLASAPTELLDMLELALLVHRISSGALDVTAEPLRLLWATAADEQLQTASVVAALQRVGMHRIYVGGGRAPSISLIPGTTIGLHGIERAYAVDQMIDVLRSRGVSVAAIESAGLFRAIGSPPDNEGRGWAVRTGEIAACTGDAACAFAHLGWARETPRMERSEELVVDPRTGYPIPSPPQVIVYAPTCAEARALACALQVMQPEPAIALIDSLGSTEARIVSSDDPAASWQSRGLDDLPDSAR